MVNQVKRESDKAAELFEQFFQAHLNAGNFNDGGELIKLSGKEADQLATKFTELLDKLPDTAERANFRNKVAKLVGAYKGTPKELVTADRLAVRLDGAFQAKVAAGGVQLQAQASGPAKTNIDISGVKTGAAAAEILEAVVGSHLADDIKWTVKGDANAGFNGNKVRITKEETNRIKALIDELYAKIPKKEVADFHKRASTIFAQQGSDYEIQKKFPELASHLSKGFQRLAQ